MSKVIRGKRDCYAIMPITEPSGYDKGHFDRVFEQVFKPACEKAGFRPTRAGDVLEKKLVHLDLFANLVKAPLVLCDVSGRNPNVLFELGFRLAFDKPVVLVQDDTTSILFDLQPLRHVVYCKDMDPGKILRDRKRIAEAIKAIDRDPGQKGDSLVQLLTLQRAVLEESKSGPLQLIQAQVSDLRSELRNIVGSLGLSSIPEKPSATDLEILLRNISEVLKSVRAGDQKVLTAAAEAKEKSARELIDIRRKYLELSDPFPVERYEAARLALRQLEVELGAAMRRLR